ncbi:RagB/SusD family nutrient uptake outer membrane protein [Sphingobacterium hungaricum]
MNKKLNIFFASLLLFTCFSCEKFLDRDPLSQVGADDFFNSETNATAAVNGMYRTLLSSFTYGQTMVIIPEFSAGHVSHTGSFPEYELFATDSLVAANAWTTNSWQGIYATINSANNIIKHVPEMDASLISEQKGNEFVGEAKFVRALSYFYLVRAFGNVPLKLEPTEETENPVVDQAAPAVIYDQIIKDLTEAEETLPASYADVPTTKGRAHVNTAKALLAKVHLYHASITNDYSKALEYSEEILALTDYSLVGDYGSIWSAENTTESIFELQFDNQATNPLAAVSNANASLLFYVKPENRINTLYADEDKRKDATLVQATVNSTDRIIMGKFPNFNPASQNLPLIRLSEIYLIHAEAAARVSNSVSTEAYNSLKAVQERAGLTPDAIGSFTSVNDFVKKVQLEKELELLFEGETWFDFCRTGLALEVLPWVSNENQFLYPIPPSQIAINPSLEQNPGY